MSVKLYALNRTVIKKNRGVVNIFFLLKTTSWAGFVMSRLLEVTQPLYFDVIPYPFVSYPHVYAYRYLLILYFQPNPSVKLFAEGFMTFYFTFIGFSFYCEVYGFVQVFEPAS